MGENQIMEKKLSLQKLIAEIIVVAYSLVLLMLVFLEVYMFATYRDTIREKWQNALYESAQKVEGTIDSINVNMYELYSYDTNFKALETARGLDCLAYVFVGVVLTPSNHDWWSWRELNPSPNITNLM